MIRPAKNKLKRKKASSAGRKTTPKEETQQQQRDASLIEAAANSFALDDVAFELWQATHANLDVHLLTFISDTEAQTGVTKDIRFSRTVSDANRCGSPTRIKAHIVIQVPPFSSTECIIRFHGQGDQHGMEMGDLIVKVIVKQRSDRT